VSGGIALKPSQHEGSQPALRLFQQQLSLNFVSFTVKVTARCGLLRAGHAVDA
jgi:hypothetical protein